MADGGGILKLKLWADAGIVRLVLNIAGNII